MNQMIYILESGDYSDYTYHAIVDAPEGLDFDAMYEEVMAEAKAAQVEAYKEYAKSPTGDWARKALAEGRVNVGADETVVAWVRAFERRGGKEVRYTAVHVGDKYRADKPEIEAAVFGSQN